jgi:hypothetical protein
MTRPNDRGAGVRRTPARLFRDAIERSIGWVSESKLRALVKTYTGVELSLGDANHFAQDVAALVFEGLVGAPVAEAPAPAAPPAPVEPPPPPPEEMTETPCVVAVAAHRVDIKARAVHRRATTRERVFPWGAFKNVSLDHEARIERAIGDMPRGTFLSSGGLAAKSGVPSSLARAVMLFLGSHGFGKLTWEIYHSCEEHSIDSRPHEHGFVPGTYECPNCGEECEGDDLRYELGYWHQRSITSFRGRPFPGEPPTEGVPS